MAELSLFYDGVLQDNGKYDRAYTSADWAKYFENIFRNGVMMSVGEALRVAAADSVGMRVVVKAGSASLKGYQYINTTAFALPIEVASSTQDRIDSIVVRHDLNARRSYVAVKKEMWQSNAHQIFLKFNWLLFEFHEIAQLLQQI